MTLLVTGGAGFIGSNFIFYWMKHYPEDRVICVDKLTYAGNIAALQPMMDRPNFRFAILISVIGMALRGFLKMKGLI